MEDQATVTEKKTVQQCIFNHKRSCEHLIGMQISFNQFKTFVASINIENVSPMHL